MVDSFWKAFERYVASLFGGKRRGPDVEGGKTDVIKPGWAIECKTWSRISFSDIQKAIEQARENREHEDDIPIAVLKIKGQQNKTAIVAMNIMDFKKHFVD